MCPGVGWTVMKGKNVSTLRQFHPDGIFGAFGGIILSQLGAETPGLYTDGRIQLRIEISRASEDFGGNLIFLQG